MSIIKVSVAGITGKFARLLMTHLLSHENVEIHGICRTPSKVAAEFTNDPRTKIFEASMTDKEKIEEAIKGTDICVCCYLGDESVMLDGQKLLIDACISQNVPRFMDSGYTFDYRGLEMGDAPQKDFCKKIQAYLDERKDRIRGVQILNGAFTEVVFAPFYGLFDANKRSVSYWGSGDEKVEMTTYDDAAKFAAEVAVDKKAVGYQSVLGDRKSAKEIAASIEEAYGVKVELIRLGSLEQLHSVMEAQMAKEPQNVFSWMGMNYTYHGFNGSTYLPQNLDMYRYSSLKVANFEEFLRRYTIDTLAEAYMF